jgi:hypothetical protein
MHYPQLPDLNDTGMDVLAGPLSVDPDGQDIHEKFLADDFLCTSTGLITDIHIWASYNGDIRFTQTPWFSLVIYENIPAGIGDIQWSRPGRPLWDAYLKPTAERIYATDVQEGFYDPNPDEIIGSDANVWQFNFKIDPCDAFEQEEGKIYWLGLHHSFDLDADTDVDVADVIMLVQNWPYGPFGWKTSGVEQYEDDAVWTEVFTWATGPHVVPDSTAAWLPLDYPQGHPYEHESFDLAFVINSVEDPKHKRLKWSQPPIEWDPTTDTPVYCGWDEFSFRSWVDPTWYAVWNCKTQCHGDADCDGDVDGDDEIILLNAWPPNPYDPRADFNRDLAIDANDQNILASNWGTNPPADCAGRPQDWQMVAGDYRCLGHMPVDSVHWWGSYYEWDNPGEWPPPFALPVAWRVGFWSNASCNELYGAAAPPGTGGSPSSLYKIDPSTGAAALIGPIDYNGVTGLSFGPDGTLYASAKGDGLYADGFQHSILLTIDTTTGAGTFVGEIGSSANPTDAGRMPDISFSPNGRLYGSAAMVGALYNHALYTINTTTGAGTLVGTTGFGSTLGNGMDFAPDGKLYSTPTDVVNNCLARLNPMTGAGVCVPGTQGNVPDRINALEFCDYSGVLYGSWLDWSTSNNYLVTIDLKTGLPKIVGQTVSGLTALAFAPSRPDKLVHQFQVPADRVDMNEVGYDDYFGWYPYDICYQYYLELEPNEVFWQGQFLDDTMGNIFWLSIAAVYGPDVDEITNPWGWKTRPWPWMDDAMRFWLDANPEPNMVLDPCNMEPIVDPEFQQSFDVAFELDTRRDYVKWDEPFTGIREWPHYEDEQSVGYELTFVEYGSKYIQLPDLSPNGIDVDATVDTSAGAIWSPQRIADDFNCTVTGPITDIHIWGSWYHDIMPNGDPEQVDFSLYIFSDDPCTGPGDWSEPNEALWAYDFTAGDFDVSLAAVDVNEGYYVPCEVPPYYEREADDICLLYNFYIDPTDAFFQRGDPCHPVVYWLVVEARPWYDPDLTEQARFGWKTSKEHWNDDGVWTDDDLMTLVDWEELRYPPGHPNEGNSIDLAFEITTGRIYTQFAVERQVADDWPCEHNEPVTDAAWWGSYMGYQYAACQEPQPLPPPRPKYFWLTIWDDVPAGHFNNEYDYSHPNDTWMWEYKAYDWDEVLVGYDKYPEDPGADPGREAVFRYSVDLPEEAWFYQEEPNSVYWFSVVAVYDVCVPDPNWGWTNHEHVYNDDAVAGYYDASGGGWTWEELYDQTDVNSVDMSFTLFTEQCLVPGKTVGGVYITPAMYNLWLSLGRPECWCYDCHSKGDSDGDCDVDTGDITTLIAGWNSYLNGLCTDTDNDGDVDTGDVTNTLNGWNNGCPPGCVPLP